MREEKKEAEAVALRFQGTSVQMTDLAGPRR